MERSAWFPYNVFDQNKAKHYLLCFAHSGAAASVFNGWNKKFDTNIGICPIQLPGRENRMHDAFIYDFYELIEQLSNVIIPNLDKSFSLFGHSLGATIAYELTLALEKQNFSPQYLFVSSCSAPDSIVNNLSSIDLSDNNLIEIIKKYQGTNDKIISNKAALNFLLPRLRADFSVFSSYKQNNIPISAPIAAFVGANDGVMSLDSVRRWELFTSSTSPFNLHLIGNGHFYYQTNTDQLITKIMQYLCTP